MKKPYELHSADSEILCPDCGSLNINEDENHVAKTGSGKPLTQYACKDCGIMFIPALVGQNSKDGSNKIKKWAKKNRTNEGINEGQSWSTEDKIEYIIIKKVVK